MHTNSPVTVPFPQNRVSFSEPDLGSCFDSAVLGVFGVPAGLANILGHPFESPRQKRHLVSAVRHGGKTTDTKDAKTIVLEPSMMRTGARHNFARERERVF